MRPIGFSTGAIAKGNFRYALRLLRDFAVDAVELSALRVSELQPLVSALPTFDLSAFNFISIHAPSQFDRKSESSIIEALSHPAAVPFPVVVESLIDAGQSDIATERERAQEALGISPLAPVPAKS